MADDFSSRKLPGGLPNDDLPLMGVDGGGIPTKILPIATALNSGVMSSAQAAKLAGLTPGMATTLPQAYAAGGAGPQLIALDVVRKGIQIQDQFPSLGVNLFDVTDGGAFNHWLTVLPIGNVFLGASLQVTGNINPVTDLVSNLGNNVTPLRFFNIAGVNYQSGISPMGFSSEAFQSGASPPIFIWNADGRAAASQAGIIYRFNVGSEPLHLFDLLNVASGAVLLGYQAGAAITSLLFNNLGLTVTSSFGGTVGSSSLLPGANATQFLGLTNNRWLLVAAGISGEFASLASPVAVTNAQHSIGVSGAGARTVNLPAANTLTRGFEIYVQDTGNSAGVISITPNGADTINGVNAAVTTAIAFGTRRLVCDGVSAWFSSGVI